MLARTGAFRLAPRIAGARRTFLMMTPEEVKKAEQVEADLLKVLPDNMKPVIEYGVRRERTNAALLHALPLSAHTLLRGAGQSAREACGSRKVQPPAGRRHEGEAGVDGEQDRADCDGGARPQEL